MCRIKTIEYIQGLLEKIVNDFNNKPADAVYIIDTLGQLGMPDETSIRLDEASQKS